MFNPQIAASASRPSSFVGAYHQVGVHTAVADATPHQLVAMLFDGLFDAMLRAQGALAASDHAAKGQAIGRAVRIVDEGLKASLDVNAGGTLASDLRDLYAYVCLRLTQANLRNDAAALQECIALMQPLRDAWSAIGHNPESVVRN